MKPSVNQLVPAGRIVVSTTAHLVAWLRLESQRQPLER
jgi:hypothetical protein